MFYGRKGYIVSYIKKNLSDMMRSKGTLFQFRVALGSAEPLADPLQVGVLLYRHPEAVGLHIVNHKRA